MAAPYIPITGTGTAGESTRRRIISGAFGGFAAATIRDDTLVNSGSPLKVETMDLAAGWNALTAPTGAKMVSIIPPSDNAETLTLKGVTGDTGVPLDPVGGADLTLAASPTIGLAAGDTVTGVQVIWY